MAVLYGNAEIKVFKDVKFIPYKIFHEFIEYHYGKRLDCRKQGNTVGAAFHKDILNMSFGKMGERYYPQVEFGTAQYIRNLA